LRTAKHILFICHESSRTGAPISLLYFIRWIKNNTDQKFVILIDKGGDLDEAFRNIGPTYILRPRRQSLVSKIWAKIGYQSFINNQLKSIIDIPFSIIYNNTIANGILLETLKKETQAYVFTHIHELESVIQSSGGKNIRLVKKYTNHFIAASIAVKNNLIHNHQILDKNITIHYECIEFIPDTSGRNETTMHLPLNKSDFIIGGAGFVDYRKGFDLYLETAKKLINENYQTDFKFIWVGGFGRNIQKMVADYIRSHNLTNHVFFLGEKKNPYPYYQMFDLFYLTSREDPFPLVMLENASLGKTIIGFRGTGGFEEFVDYDSDLLIDSFDIQQATDVIIKLKNNETTSAKVGNRLKNKVYEKYMMGSNGMKYFSRIKQLAGYVE